jgi:hypothetical protein
MCFSLSTLVCLFVRFRFAIVNFETPIIAVLCQKRYELHNNAASFYERDCPKEFIYIKMSSEADEKLTPRTKKNGYNHLCTLRTLVLYIKNKNEYDIFLIISMNT